MLNFSFGWSKLTGFVASETSDDMKSVGFASSETSDGMKLVGFTPSETSDGMNPVEFVCPKHRTDKKEFMNVL